MIFNFAVISIVLAGLMNSAFALPARYIKNISSVKIWLLHSFFGLGILPWIILACIIPEAFLYYFLLNKEIFIILISSGIIFGIGQICFAKAINSIGIALSFTINLSIGITIGSMFVVFSQNNFFTTQNYFVIAAILLIIASLFISYFSERNQKHSPGKNSRKLHYTGWILASLTGITSGLQNITFVLVAFHLQKQVSFSNAFWVWPPFLSAAAIPMTLGFYLQLKNIRHSKTLLHSVKRVFFPTVLMGIFFTGSLALYSYTMNHLNNVQQVIGWPVFMVSIILGSHLWSWLYKEKIPNLLSLLLLIIAIIILSINVPT